MWTMGGHIYFVYWIGKFVSNNKHVSVGYRLNSLVLDFHPIQEYYHQSSVDSFPIIHDIS